MSFIGRFRGNQRNRLVQRCGYASTARLRSEKNADREEREKVVVVGLGTIDWVFWRLENEMWHSGGVWWR